MASETLSLVKGSFEAVTKLNWDETKLPNPSVDFGKENMTLLIKMLTDIMSLMQYKFTVEDMRLIAENFSFLILSQNGLTYLIQASIDIDETSQRNTTIDQRCQKFGCVVAFIPKLCCSQIEYYDLLSVQLFSLLTAQIKSQEDNSRIHIYKKIATAIITSLLKRNPKLAKKFIIQPLLISIKSKDSKMSISKSILAIHNLLNCRFDCNYFQAIFPHLFYIGCLLENKISYLKNITYEIGRDLVEHSSHSEYLIDNALFSRQDLTCVYTFGEEISFTSQKISEELDLKSIDSIVQFTIKLIDVLKGDSKIDLFLLLIERLSTLKSLSMSQQLILCSLIDSVHQSANEEITKYPSKSIKFVASILKKTISHETVPAGNEAEFDNEVENLSIDSKSLAIEVISVIMNEKHKVSFDCFSLVFSDRLFKQLSNDDMSALKQCTSDLESLSLKEQDENVQKRLNSLRDEISNLNFESIKLGVKSNDKFEEALRDLNDPLLPVRAHALVSLKNLIYAKDPSTLENSHMIVERLKVSIENPTRLTLIKFGILILLRYHHAIRTRTFTCLL